MLSNHLILCHPLLLLFSIFPSIRVFSNVSALHIRWPKYCSFSFRISPSNEYSWDLPNPEIEPGSPDLKMNSLPSEIPGKPYYLSMGYFVAPLWQVVENRRLVPCCHHGYFAMPAYFFLKCMCAYQVSIKKQLKVRLGNKVLTSVQLW